MKLFFVKLALFVGLVLAFLEALDMYYTRYTLANKNVCQKPDWVLNHHNEAFDFAFIGNSRVFNMVDIPAIEKITGKKGINLGMTGTNYSELYLLLDQFLKEGNSIKNLAIETDMINLNSKKVEFLFHGYSYVHLINDSVVSAVYRDNFPIYKYIIWKYVPFIRYMEFSNRFVFYKIMKGGFECRTFDGLDTTKGTVFFINSKFPKAYEHETWSVDQLDEKYLYKLIDLAVQKGIHVIMYTAPVYTNYVNDQVGYAEIMKHISDIAVGQHIPYLNFSRNDNPQCSDRADFYDNTHLNIGGVKRFSTSLGDSLKTYLK